MKLLTVEEYETRLHHEWDDGYRQGRFAGAFWGFVAGILLVLVIGASL